MILTTLENEAVNLEIFDSNDCVDGLVVMRKHQRGSRKQAQALGEQNQVAGFTGEHRNQQGSVA